MNIKILKDGFYGGELFIDTFTAAIEKGNYKTLGSLYGLSVIKIKDMPDKEAWFIKDGKIKQKFFIK